MREGGLDPALFFSVFPQFSLSLFSSFKNSSLSGVVYVFVAVPVGVCVCVVSETCNQESLHIKGPPVIKELVGG